MIKSQPKLVILFSTFLQKYLLFCFKEEKKEQVNNTLI